MRCPACGMSIATDAIYCQQCGSRVSTAGLTWLEDDESRRHDAGQRHDRFWPRATGRRIADERDYIDDERLLWKGTYSWKGMIHEFLVAAVVTLLLVSAGVRVFRDATAWFYIIAFLSAIWLLIFSVLVFRKLNFRYTVTDQRLIHETGILYQFLDRTEMIDIDDVRVEQGIIERVVNVGKIRLRTSDQTHPSISFRGIDRVRDVASLIDDARRRERMQRGLHVEAV